MHSVPEVTDREAEEVEANISPEHPLVRVTTKNKKLGSAARLPYFIAEWEQVTSCKFILNIIKYGYIIQFEADPFQEKFIERHFSDEITKICLKKIKELLSSKAIISVDPDPGQFLSNIFPVPKKSLNEYRIILDLSKLNKFVKKISFKMDSLDYIISMIRPGDFFISIDISDAYYSVAMNILSTPYLTFKFLNILYQFMCLPQGLTSAPRIFTRILRVVMSFLRAQSFRIASWLDDLLLIASSFALAYSQAVSTLNTLESLGFTPNYEKSVLTPSQKNLYLGLFWDSISYTVFVPIEKLKDVKIKCKTAKESKVKIELLSSILGSIEYFRWGFPFAAVHYRLLQRFVNECLAEGLDYHSKVFVSLSACQDLNWWINSGSSLPARSLSPFTADITICSDASLQGWGGWTSDNRESLGSWSSSERLLHIKYSRAPSCYFSVSLLFQIYF